MGRVPTPLPALLSSQEICVLGPGQRDWSLDSWESLGLGITVQQQEGFQPDTRKNFLDWERRERNPSLHSPSWSWMQGPPSQGEVAELVCPLRELGWGMDRAKVEARAGGDCTLLKHTHSAPSSWEAENFSNGEHESEGWLGAGLPLAHHPPFTRASTPTNN